MQKPVVGRKVAFQYNGNRYVREVTEVCDIIHGTWVLLLYSIMGMIIFFFRI